MKTPEVISRKATAYCHLKISSLIIKKLNRAENKGSENFIIKRFERFSL